MRCILVAPTGAKEEFHHVANFPTWRQEHAKEESSPLEQGATVQWIVSVGVIMNKEKAMRRVESYIFWRNNVIYKYMKPPLFA